MPRAVIAVLTLLAAVLVAPAEAAKGPCLPGGKQRCHIWQGKVISVNDGDTFDAMVGGVRERIRFTAIQALELKDHAHNHRTGECHAIEATLRVEALLRKAHQRVRLAALNPGARDPKQNRRLRGVALKVDGKLRDLGELLIGEGRAAFMANTTETQFNAAYIRAQQEAEQDRIGLFDTDHCKAGPQQDVPIQVWANTDPLSIDNDHVNDEQVVIRNLGAETLKLTGWTVRTGTMRKYYFKKGASVAPGKSLVLHVGHGTDSAGNLFWNQDTSVFPNMGPPFNLGSGAYLFDPQGDNRAWMLYPCVIGCSDPRQGMLKVTAEYKRDEAIVVRNVSSGPVDLYGLEAAVQGSAYAFKEGTVLAAGASKRVSVAKDFNSPKNIMPDAGGYAEVRTPAGVRLDCDAWGSGRC